MRLEQTPTPAAVLDPDRLEANARWMAARAHRAGLALRPHLKTAKSVEVARRLTAGHFGGITVSTLAEAEHFFPRGFGDLTYAVCMTPDRIPRAVALAEAGAQLTLLTDDVAVARSLSKARPRRPLPVLVEIDSGEHRTGVDAESEALLEIGGALHEGPGTSLAGVLTHGGHAYACPSVEAIREVAEQERSAVVRAAARLRAAGLPSPVVSAGSTPTAVLAESFEGLTELRPGVYSFFDLAQVALGVCRPDDLALTVLSTVLSHRPERGRLIIDAGGLALSKDAGGAAVRPELGYGWLLDPISQARIGDLRLVAVDQEHGYVEGTDIPFDRLPVGSRVRVAPNHACMTAAAYDEYLVAQGGAVVDRWPRINGWAPRGGGPDGQSDSR